VIVCAALRQDAGETLGTCGGGWERRHGVRLEAPSERGGVTPALAREIRGGRDMAGAGHVDVIVSGGINPERIRVLSEAGAAAFGVGSYIAHAAPRDMTMDIKVVENRPLAKRGRIPGITENPSLEQVL